MSFLRPESHPNDVYQLYYAIPDGRNTNKVEKDEKGGIWSWDVELGFGPAAGGKFWRSWDVELGFRAKNFGDELGGGPIILSHVSYCSK